MAQSAVVYRRETYFYRDSWIQLFRPMTLTGTITPVLTGTGMAAAQGKVQFTVFLAMLVASLLVQSAANLFNDYYDFLHGQDGQKWTDDSAEAHGPAHQTVFYLALTLLSAAAVIGLWLAVKSTFWIIPAGVLSILFGYLYSAGPRPLSSIGLGETVAFVFLGPVIMILSYVVQGCGLDADIFFASLPFAFMIASMILTNNIRDIAKDYEFRSTIAAIIGYKHAVHVLTALLLLVYLTVTGLILSGTIPLSAMIVLFALPFAIRLRWLLRQKSARAAELSSMKWAAWHHWAFGLLLTIGVWIT
ncbi:1,4-dihydroxy-2-naphthoate polyprenyltransferase [Barrientosiimonas marina]|uniref:Prenyltransferase n=1 Tax=Lentibacillus kimchii TaxID=1542911 RepID=A0ABW2UST3_9BACI